MVSLTEAQMPNHTHSLMAANEIGELRGPANHALARSSSALAYHTSSNLVPLADQALPNTGGSQPHNNLQPFIAMNFIIALQGLYPSRS